MKNIFIALSICFCFSQAGGQSENNKLTTERKNVISIYELLQGQWQSMDDANYIIEFKDAYYADYYNGQKGDENKFWLDKACPDTGYSGGTGDNEEYLVVGDMCWYINGISESRLELIYTARGNTLKFKRIK